MKGETPHDKKYAIKGLLLGEKTSAICDKIIGIMSPSGEFRPKLLDLGCGEGRNDVYFAKHGFEVVGVDMSLVGLEKTKKYAKRRELKWKPSTLILMITRLTRPMMSSFRQEHYIIYLQKLENCNFKTGRITLRPEVSMLFPFSWKNRLFLDRLILTKTLRSLSQEN